MKEIIQSKLLESHQTIKTSIAYIAGLLDGEGYIGIHHGNQVTVTIANTNRECLEFIQSLFSFGTIVIRVRNPKSWKVLYLFNIHNRNEVKIFLQAVIPYLIVKREKCMLAIRTIENYSGI